MTLAQVEPVEALRTMNESDAADCMVKSEVDSLPDPPLESNRGLKVLFLSSDTGGGHRASAESLARQFQLMYPGRKFATEFVKFGLKMAPAIRGSV